MLKRIVFAATLLFAGVILSCDERAAPTKLAEPCHVNSDCGGDLVCALGKCHTVCANTKDCPIGQRCVKTDTSAACQLPIESKCALNSDCIAPLVCGIDRNCRSQCAADRDCLTEQFCDVSLTCADRAEVPQGGRLPDNGGPRPDAGNGSGGTSGAGGANGSGGAAGQAGAAGIGGAAGAGAAGGGGSGGSMGGSAGSSGAGGGNGGNAGRADGGDDDADTDGSAGAAGTDGGGDASTTNCKNLQCFQNNCTLTGCKVPACPSGTTTVSGVVYDPAGIHPLYNVIVYVPNTPIEPIPTGATCDRCGKVSGEPVTSTLTNAKGEFRLENVPVTDDVPIVVQVGKWRRQFTIPKPASCADTVLTDRNQTRLPRNKSEGHLPRIAVATGGADALECLLRKIGISESEMTPESNAGRVNFFAGLDGSAKFNASLNNGAPFSPAQPFWSSVSNLLAYDIVLLSCEGYEMSQNKPPVALTAMQDYTTAGGRVFLSHWHNWWLEKGPTPFPNVALFQHQPDLPNPFTAAVDTSFPKGQALAEWLVNAGSKAPVGQLIITEGKHTVNRPADGISQRWVYSASPVSTQYFSFNTPVGAAEDKICGRVVFSDIHASASDISRGTEFPDGCTSTTMTDQEKVLEFMLFDLSACVMPDAKPPMPPK